MRPEGYSERAIFIIDKFGIIRYVDIHNIDEQPDNEVLFRVLERMEPEAARRYAQKINADKPQVFTPPAADVVMYCTPWCPDCRQARAFFESKGIKYVEVDISHDRAAAELVRSWANGKEITPTFNVKGNIIVSYNKRSLEKALRLD